VGEGLFDLFGNHTGRVTPGMKGLGEVLGIGLKVLRMAADPLASDGQGVWYGSFGRGGVTTGVMEVLLEVGGFDMDGGAELTPVDVDINVHISHMGGRNEPGEVDRVTTVEPFKELSDAGFTMRPEDKDVINETQP